MHLKIKNTSNSSISGVITLKGGSRDGDTYKVANTVYMSDPCLVYPCHSTTTNAFKTFSQHFLRSSLDVLVVLVSYLNKSS